VQGFSSLVAETKAEERLSARTPFIETYRRRLEEVRARLTRRAVERIESAGLPEFAPNAVRNEIPRQREQVREVVRGLYEDVGERFVSDTQQRIQERTGTQPPPQDGWGGEVSAILAGAAVAGVIGAILSRLTSDINEIVESGVEDGLSPSEIAGRVEDQMPDLNESRARMEARTLITGASNRAELFAARRMPTSLRKRWVDSDDERVRLSHEVVDSDEENLGEPFRWFSPNSGRQVQAQHPGDPQLPLPDLLNCRCILVFFPV
jgi:uncharacterized protein with gpF-like domain